jgi:hypothetical protein
MAEENVYLKNKKKIRILSIDRLLEGEPPVSWGFLLLLFIIAFFYSTITIEIPL